MYSSIKSAIIAKLEAITGIKKIYGYEKGDLDGFPAATVVLVGIEAPILDNVSDSRRYDFRIRLYQEMEEDGVGAEEAESRVDALIDTLIGTFEDDYRLGGLAYNTNLKVEMGYPDRGPSMRVFDMTLEVYAIYQLT